MQARSCIFVILVFGSFDKQVVSAADCSNSLICGSEVNEILLIAAVVAVCFLFFVQSIVIVCIAYKFKKFKQSMRTMSPTRETYHSSLPNLTYKLKDSEEEDITYLTRSNGLASTFRDSKRKSRVTSFFNEGQELTVLDKPDANGGTAEIWNLNT